MMATASLAHHRVLLLNHRSHSSHLLSAICNYFFENYSHTANKQPGAVSLQLGMVFFASLVNRHTVGPHPYSWLLSYPSYCLRQPQDPFFVHL